MTSLPRVTLRKEPIPMSGLLAAIVSVVSAAGIALLVPLAVLAIGIPVALVIRGLLELILWLFRTSP